MSMIFFRKSDSIGKPLAETQMLKPISNFDIPLKDSYTSFSNNYKEFNG
jgi:hypothetical protein